MDDKISFRHNRIFQAYALTASLGIILVIIVMDWCYLAGWFASAATNDRLHFLLLASPVTIPYFALVFLFYLRRTLGSATAFEVSAAGLWLPDYGFIPVSDLESVTVVELTRFRRRTTRALSLTAWNKAKYLERRTWLHKVLAVTGTLRNSGIYLRQQDVDGDIGDVMAVVARLCPTLVPSTTRPTP